MDATAEEMFRRTHPATGSAAHSAGKGSTAPIPLVTTSSLTAEQWTQLITRVGTIPAPKVHTKPTPAAVPDPKHG